MTAISIADCIGKTVFYRCHDESELPGRWAALVLMVIKRVRDYVMQVKYIAGQPSPCYVHIESFDNLNEIIEVVDEDEMECPQEPTKSTASEGFSIPPEMLVMKDEIMEMFRQRDRIRGEEVSEDNQLRRYDLTMRAAELVLACGSATVAEKTEIHNALIELFKTLRESVAD